MHTSHLKVLVCFGIVSLFGSAYAAQDGEDKAKVSVTLYSASTDAEIKAAALAIQEDYLEAKASNPDIVPDVLVLKSTDAHTRQKRLLMAVTRGIISTAAATWSLTIQTDFPFSESILRGLPVALMLGSFSFGVQLKIDAFTRYLEGAEIKIGNLAIEKFFRWWSIEIPFLTVAKVGTILAGLNHDSFLQAVAHIFITSLSTVATQGIWDLAITEERTHRLALSLTQKLKDKVNVVSDLKMLGVSAASIGLNLALLQKVHYATPALIGMGALGLFKFALVQRQKSGCRQKLSSQNGGSNED